MPFTDNDVERFAAWSGDHNPLHVDRQFAYRSGFDQPPVHDMLAVIGALGSIQPATAVPLRTLDIEFRAPLLANHPFQAETFGDAGAIAVTSRGGELVLTLRGAPGDTPHVHETGDWAWVSRLASSPANLESGRRLAPAEREIAELRSGIELVGAYATDPPPEAAVASGYLTPLQTRVLGLCSYLAGMELPGLRSALTRAVLHFHDPRIDSSELWYRAQTIGYESETRILKTQIEVATPDGQRLATGELDCYVRIAPLSTDLAALAASIQTAKPALDGKIALVCGGSRGLGGDLTAALALAGCRVYAAFHSGAEAAQGLARKLAPHGLAVEFLQGDAGDAGWCAGALEMLRARHERLDLLVLNACAAPAAIRLGPGTASRIDAYLTANLRLASTPLATFLPLLDESRGAIACISSALVDDPQPGLAHYVALKQAVEGLVQTAAREAAGVYALIARPPRLLTSWNDTPSAVQGTIPADAAAAQIANHLARHWQPGQVGLLADFSGTFPVRVEASVEVTRPSLETGPVAEAQRVVETGFMAINDLAAPDAFSSFEFDPPETELYPLAWDGCDAPEPGPPEFERSRLEQPERDDGHGLDEIAAIDAAFETRPAFDDLSEDPAASCEAFDSAASTELRMPPVLERPGLDGASPEQCLHESLEQLQAEVAASVTVPAFGAGVHDLGGAEDKIISPLDEVHTGAAPLRLKIGSDARVTAWAIAGTAFEPFRGAPVEPWHTVERRKDLPFSLTIVEDDQMRGLLTQWGWRLVAPLQTAELLIHPEHVLKGQLSGAAALAAGWRLRASTAVRAMLQYRTRFDIQQVTRFGAGHDRLWELAARDIRCGIVRDASYLNWKHVDRPGRDVVRLEIVDSETIRGVVVLQFRDADDEAPYRRAYLIDLVAPLSDDRLLKQLLQIAGTAAAERGAAALVSRHVSPLLTGALCQNGFRLGDPGGYLFVNPGQLTEDARRQVLSAGNWFVTLGDAGSDRPEPDRPEPCPDDGREELSKGLAAPCAVEPQTAPVAG